MENAIISYSRLDSDIDGQEAGCHFDLIRKVKWDGDEGKAWELVLPNIKRQTSLSVHLISDLPRSNYFTAANFLLNITSLSLISILY